MWQVENRTAFAAERGWVRDRNGAEVWIVAVKCTFDITPDGRTEIAAEQPPVLRIAEHPGDPATSSPKYEADLVLTKTATDVVVVGHAYAPNGRSTTQMDVGFAVGPVRKIVRVFGDRVWSMTGISSPQPFRQMPIVYERAFGGVDSKSTRPERDWEWRNRVGTGFVVSRDHATGIALPNIEYPSELIGNWNARPKPAGFGPIPGHWQPRAGHAGTYDDAWMKERQPLLPKDFDERFFQTVPADQQAPGFLRGGEPVVLSGLTPGGTLRFELPRVFLGFDTRFYDGSRQLHTDRKLHTVIVEPDHPRVSLVWHSSLPCHFKVQKLERTIVTEKTDITPESRRVTDDVLEPA